MTYPDNIIDAVGDAITRVLPLRPARSDLAVAALDALVEATGGTEHIARFTATDFTLQHPLTERLDGTLFDCPVHAVIANLMRPPAIGDFTVTLVGGELAWQEVAR
jgi:hypothetical protein